MKRSLAVIASVILLLLAFAVPAAGGGRVVCPGAAGFPSSSLAKTGVGESSAQLVSVVASHGTCWDRITFTFSGPVVRGYRVAYETAFTQGRGLPMNGFVGGGERLNVVLNGHATTNYAIPVGSHAAFGPSLTFRTFRDGMYGGTFEGRTTFCVGVRARLPMRVIVATSPPRIIVDVLHLWP